MGSPAMFVFRFIVGKIHPLVTIAIKYGGLTGGGAYLS
jgi:hypothetical protein